MLEQKLDEVREALELNTVALENLRQLLLVKGLPKAEQGMAAASVPDVEDSPGPDSEEIDAEELKQLALEIIRADRAKKAAIKNIVSSLGGSSITNVPAENLSMLKVELEALR